MVAPFLELTPSKTAVLILDVQPSIMAIVSGSNECLPAILQLVDSANDAGCHAAFVRVAFTQQEWTSISPNIKNLSAMRQKMGPEQIPESFHADRAPAELHPDVQTRVREGQDIIVRKTRFGPFSSTTLLQDLQSRNIDTLILAGFKTSGAVLSALRAAADHDFRLIVVRDAVHDADPELQRVLLEKVFPEQAHVVGLKQVQEALGNA